MPAPVGAIRLGSTRPDVFIVEGAQAAGCDG